MSRRTNTQRVLAAVRCKARRDGNELKRTFNRTSIVMERLARRARRVGCDVDLLALVRAAREVTR